MTDVHDATGYDAIIQAQAELPAVKARYRAGLPPGDTLFLRVLRPEHDGVREEVVVKVARWGRGRIHGIVVLEPTDFGNSAAAVALEAFDDAAAIDWIIVKADGTQDGNRLRYEREERWE